MYKFLILLAFLTVLSGRVYSTGENEKADAEKTALSFYEWYINNDAKINIEFVESEDGKTNLIADKYFEDLKNLGIISEKFIEKEKVYLKPFADFFKTVKWSKYSNAPKYEFAKECAFLYYYYWFKSQEKFDGAEVKESEVNDNNAKVTLIFYKEKSGKKNYWKHSIAHVELEKEKGAWKITGIVLE